MEAVAEPKRAITRGDTRSPRARVACVSFFPVVYVSSDAPLVVYFSREYTAARSPHVPRTGKVRAGARVHGLGLSWKLSWSPNELVLQEIRAHRLFAHVCRYNAGGAFELTFTTAISMSKLVLAWSRAFMEAVAEPKRASTRGDTRSSRARVACVSFFPVVYISSDAPLVVYFSREYTTAARSRHVPRTGKVLAGARVHGLGLSWGPNELVMQ